MKRITKTLRKKLANIKLLIVDTDGVMTKPFVIWSGSDNNKKSIFESKLFCIHDGSACWVASEAGLKIVLVSGRSSETVYQRAKKIRIDEVFLNSINKLAILDKVMDKYKIQNTEIGYIGDDFLDLPILKKVGVAFSVNDSVEEVKEVAHFISDKNGGEGAVAEIIRLILTTQGKWKTCMDAVLKKIYLNNETISDVDK